MIGTSLLNYRITEKIGAGGQFRRKNFDDDRATETLVNGFIDCALTARADLFRDAVI